jgi:prevent-host-death family protein
METVGLKELKNHLGAYVRKARDGEPVLITERGREVAVLEPLSDARKAMLRLSRTGRARWDGGKPTGLEGIRMEGRSLSDTVLKDRR